MIATLALRSLATRPLRTLILAVGFGLGIAVMAILLGVGEVVLQQAQSPALQGGGDILLTGATGGVESARFVLGSVLRRGELGASVEAASPWRRATLFLVAGRRRWRVIARGGIPSLEGALGDKEIADARGWTDEAADRAWSAPDAGDVLRAMDRFHRVPDLPEFASSWAEWLYFNGRTADGRTGFYLTFMVGPRAPGGRRTAGVRLQLKRNGVQENFSARGELDEQTLLDRAPDLDIAGNRVRLDGQQYRIDLHLTREGQPGTLSGSLSLDASSRRSLPPIVMHGARGWISGYTVPVLSGAIRGTLGSETIEMAGYHDHNWGFWDGVRWQWGQVAHDDVSFVYGRVFPPPTVADPARVPGFLGVLGPEGVLGIGTQVSITERSGGEGDRDEPRAFEVNARGRDVDVRLRLAVDQAIRSPFGLTRSAGPVTFLQLAGTYQVSGRAADRQFDFTGRGSAETFR